MLANPLADLRYSLRGLARRPGFAAVVVSTLAIGIGVNVAVFSLYDQIMLRQLPVADPSTLVNFAGPGPQPGLTTGGVQGGSDEIFSYPMFRDLERAESPLVGLAASRLIRTNLGYAGTAQPANAMLVSGQYFSLLGLGPSLGRLLGPQDDTPGSAASAVLSYEYWANAMGADPGVLGTTLVVNGKPLEIVGIAPRGFEGTAVGERVQVFVPISGDWFIPSRLDNRFYYWVYVFGRLKPRVSLEEAEAAINVPYSAAINEVELAAAAADYQAAEPLARARVLEQFRAKSIELKPGAQGQSRAPQRTRTPLAIFFGATATVLLIACLNLANLMFARGAARIGEMAIRTSMGAARHRLVWLLGSEAILLAALAAVLSLPIALGTLEAVGALMPANLVSAPDLSLNVRAAGVAFGIAALSTVVFALAPMLKLAATDPARALQASGAGRAFGGKGLGRFRFALSTSQIALSMLMLVLAGLFTQSLANVARVDLGLHTESLLTFTLAPAQNGYTAEQGQQLFDRVEEELARYPGVTDTTSSFISLLGGSPLGGGVSLGSWDNRVPAYYNYVGARYLRTTGISLLAGRELTAADGPDGPFVAMVSESLAKALGLGRDVVGEHVRIAGREQLVEIVGLFRDSALHDAKEPATPQLVMPRTQTTLGAIVMSFYLRTGQDPESLLAAIPRIVAGVDPSLPATNVRTLASQIRNNTRTDWLLATLAGTLAIVATLLAALGLFGVLSYAVTQRTREIGLRLALGAAPPRVRGLVLKQAVWMAAIGVPIGLAGALALGQLAKSLLFDLEPTYPAAFVGGIVLLLAVVFGASYIPARRASRVDPAVALRSE